MMATSFSTRVAACLPSTSLLVERRVNSVAPWGRCRAGNVHCRSPLQQDREKQERREVEFVVFEWTSGYYSAG